MQLEIYNSSNMEISVKMNDAKHTIPPKETCIINNDSNAYELTLNTNNDSFIDKFHNTVIGYKFNVESVYSVFSTTDFDTISLKVIGVEGDHYEYYLRVVPHSDTANIKLKSYDIPDAEKIKKDVIFDYSTKQEKRNASKSKGKRDDFFIEILLDVKYSILPALIIYAFAHKYVTNATMAIIIIATVIVVVTISQLSQLFFDKVLIKKAIPNSKEFDINSIFNESHIKNIVNDTERYQNIK